MLPMLLMPALQAPAPNPFASLEFLLGAWEGEGGGEPGQGSGAFSFAMDVQGAVMVRRNRTGYPATKDRPAAYHEDLMVVFIEGGRLKAHYYDNDGHVIRYVVSGPDNRGAVQFLSEAGPGPRFRLSYTPIHKDGLSIRFEIAPPGNPEGFKTYIEAMAHRKK